MKEKGFTLIELLAVIVILAIIALIATPIILGIINDARVESQERSAELYLSAVDLAVVKRNMTEEFSPEECTITEGVVTCTGYEDPLNVEIDGETPVSGTIKFENNKVTTGTTLTFSDFTATLNEENKIEVGKIEESGEKFEIGKLSSVCEPAETQYFQQTAMEPGYEYNCKVDPNAEPYTFYVLNKTDNQINLIMDRNTINIETDWITEEIYTNLTGNTCENMSCIPFSYWELGPIVPMRKLVEATSTWTNLKSMTINTFEKDNATVALGESYAAYARLPKASELGNYTIENAYLYNHVAISMCANENGEEITCSFPEGLELTGSDGYTTQSIDTDYEGYVISGFGAILVPRPPIDLNIGIRPVITLDIQ